MDDISTTAIPVTKPTRRYRGVVLAMLLLVYTFNFLDRQILGILVGPIKADLGLNDTQLGALGGIAFALLYTSLGIPLALLADRTSRTWVITISLTVWSGFTALCGIATSFWQLFLFRLGVGVGEAGGVAPSYAVIAEYFPSAERARALAIYSLGIPLGSAAGVLLGGYVAALVEWRTAFLVVGIAGIAIAPLFRLIVREPPKGQFDAIPVEKAPIGAVFGILARKRSFWLISFGASFSSMCGYGIAFWLPSLMQRSFGLDLVQTSQFYGAVLLLGGIAGVLAGGWLGDYLGARDRGNYVRLPAIAYLLAIPFFAAGVLSSSVTAAFLLFLLPQALSYIWIGPVLSAVQHLVPPQMRASASASFLFINNLIGIGLGTMILGALSDALTVRFGAEALRYAILSALGFYAIAALLMALAAKALRNDWVG
ncbi:spinster family MFS transporter [Sphingobium algorifonticola]|uniref:MFS transporter n=1 Tax=Sphingobium algorifonticola TaxID=2008318 RepID=A0A437JD66_9SPHN|nr:MFS transporter [Sphingobium algorifonticola]RVT43859.1 MFS transporter [Sphingobium algorifonticola]